MGVFGSVSEVVVGAMSLSGWKLAAAIVCSSLAGGVVAIGAVIVWIGKVAGR